MHNKKYNVINDMLTLMLLISNFILIYYEKDVTAIEVKISFCKGKKLSIVEQLYCIMTYHSTFRNKKY